MVRQLKIGYGVLVPPIAEQLAEQGFELADADRYEKQRHAINVLMFGDLTTDSQHTALLEKLHKRIVKNVKEVKK